LIKHSSSSNDESTQSNGMRMGDPKRNPGVAEAGASDGSTCVGEGEDLSWRSGGGEGPQNCCGMGDAGEQI
jgi:hypothetical protein